MRCPLPSYIASTLPHCLEGYSRATAHGHTDVLQGCLGRAQLTFHEAVSCHLDLTPVPSSPGQPASRCCLCPHSVLTVHMLESASDTWVHSHGPAILPQPRKILPGQERFGFSEPGSSLSLLGLLHPPQGPDLGDLSSPGEPHKVLPVASHFLCPELPFLGSRFPPFLHGHFTCGPFPEPQSQCHHPRLKAILRCSCQF